MSVSATSFPLIATPVLITDAGGDTRKESERQLVAALLSHDPSAWRAFQQRYDRLIYRCITKVTARFSARLGADDVREVYASLLLQLLANDMHKLRTFDPERGNRLGSWVGMLAVNAAYDHLRSLRRDGQRTPLSEVEAMCADEPDAFELCERRERAAKVGAVMKDFSSKDRQFMELYFAQGLDPEEVARRMHISVKTVYSKKHKIRSRLEALMVKDQEAA